MPRLPLALLVLLSVAFLVACDETDLVTVRIRVEDDLSGQVATSSLVVPDPDREHAIAVLGATWEERVDVVNAVGSFEDLSDVVVEDIVFRAGSAGSRLNYLEVELPRGPNARWPRRLVPLSRDERRDVARAVDPSGALKAVGTTVKLEVRVPTRIVGHGINTRPRGSKEKAEEDRATLLVPIERALVDDDPLIWHITWRKAVEDER